MVLKLIAIALISIILAIGGVTTYLAISQNTQFVEVEKPIYLDGSCSVQECDAGIHFAPETPQDSAIQARVFGTIYEDSDNASILGTCSDSNNQPLQSSTANVTVYNPDTSKLTNQKGMRQIDVGRFNYSLTVPTSRGNYLVMLNCTDGTSYAVAYTEFQNPPWTNKIQQLLTAVASLGSASQYNNNVKDFEIDSLRTNSPIYPNETIHIESTFSDENGTLVTPTAVNLTIMYPNRTIFRQVGFSALQNQNSIWNYSVTFDSSPRTGTYYIQMIANNSLKQAAKTIQFRVATGGPFSLRLNCPAAAEIGSTLTCIVEIVDEGEVAVESVTTVWIDVDGDSILDATEPQTSFSKETVPQQEVTESAILDILSTLSPGTYVVRAKTTYLNSDQPDSHASDTVIILAGSSTGGTTEFGGAQGGTFTCSDLILQHLTCYYPSANAQECIKGCPQDYVCTNSLRCVSKTQIITPTEQKELSFWEKIKLFFQNLMDPKFDKVNFPTPSAISKEPSFTEQIMEEGVIPTIQDHPLTSVFYALLLIFIILATVFVLRFGFKYLLSNPIALLISGIMIGALIWLWLKTMA